MLNYELPPLGGGGGVFCVKLAKGYINAGYTVDYVTSGYKDLKKFEVIEGINIYRVPAIGRKGLQTASMLSMLSYVVFGTIKSIQLLLKNRYTFIHSIFVIPSGPVGYIVSKLFKIPHLLTLVGGDIYDPSKKTSPHRKWYWKKIISFLINTADKLTAISTDVKNSSIKYYSPKKDIKVVALPYEIQIFTPKTRKELNLDDDKIYLVSVGRLVKRKGYEYLIEAIAKLKNSGVECLIIGDGPEKQNLQALAEKLNIANQIHLLGYLPLEIQKFEYLNVADIYVLSSIHEGFGIVLQEAMQVGLPLISTNVGGQTDVVIEGRNGILVRPADSENLAKTINELINNPNMRKRFKDNNLVDVKIYDFNNISRMYLDNINV